MASDQVVQPAAASVQLKMCWRYQHSSVQHLVKMLPNPDKDMKHVLRFTDSPDAEENLEAASVLFFHHADAGARRHDGYRLLR